MKANIKTFFRINKYEYNDHHQSILRSAPKRRVLINDVAVLESNLKDDGVHCSWDPYFAELFYCMFNLEIFTSTETTW